MVLASSALTIIDGVIWILCLLVGIGICSSIGGFIGKLLGWMIANSTDSSMASGGRVGRQVGRLVGMIIGAGLAIFGAYHATALIAQVLGHTLGG